MWTFSALPDYAFPRLRALLDGSPPGRDPIDLAIGEPKHPYPAFVPEILHREASGYGRYPPPAGTPDVLEAIAGWLTRRYGLPEPWIDPARQIVALNGTREGLFMAAQTVAGVKPAPVVLMPNPFYQCYAAAAVAIRAEPVFLDATAATGHLPDLEAIPRALLDRTAAFYLCSPANPQGTVATPAYWTRLLDLAETHDFIVLADECYAEIYDTEPPTGILEAAQARAGAPDRVLTFHSLSKRSNLPGLRSGFVAGDPALIDRVKKLRSYGGAPLPLPVCAASAALWREDGHVAENRALYRRKVDLAAEYLSGTLDFFRPPGGFFLWLNTGILGLTGEAAALRLWREAGLRVLPGSYLARDGESESGRSADDIVTGQTADRTVPRDGAVPQRDNPGRDYIRVALVHDESVTIEALSRLVATVGE